MGIDGFSMGNLGLNAEFTSAQMATQSEHIAQLESEIKIKNVDESAQDGGVKRKEDEDSEKNQFNDGFKENQDENEGESDENDSPRQSLISEKDVEDNPRGFSVRLNSDTQKIELFNTKNKRVVETINPEELMFLISKLDSASGVLVNRKI